MAEKMNRIIFIDVDHTITDAAWRDNMIGVEVWDVYHEASQHDKPIVEIVALVNDLHASGWTIIGLTARPEKWRQLTMDWMLRYEVLLHELIMRPDDCYLPSPELKLEQALLRMKELEEGDIVIVFDDRDDVVKAFKGAGITAVQIHTNRNEPIDAQKIADQNAKEQGLGK